MKHKGKRTPLMSFFVLSLMALIAPGVARAQGGAKVPICNENQLLAYYQGWGLSMATDYAKVIFRNRSAYTCRLHGLPRIRQFDEQNKELHAGFPGGCPKDPAPEPCDDLVLKPSQRASFIIAMSDGTGLENPICAYKLVLDSPPHGGRSWPLLTLEGFVSCGRIGPYAFEYQTTSGVEIDPYTSMGASFPRGVPSGGWSLNLIDANAAMGHPPGTYEPRYDPPFSLILQNENPISLLPTAKTWCDGGVTIELRGPDRKLLRRTPPPCEEPESRNPGLSPPISTLALTLYLYDLGYDLTRTGEYNLRARWRLPASTPRAAGQSGSAETSNDSVLVESNEIIFTVSN